MTSSKTGFLQSDINAFRAKGNTMASGMEALTTPTTKTKYAQGSSSFSGVFASKDGGTSSNNDLSKMLNAENVETMANVFAARLSNIRNKKMRPGLMQTRGER